MYHPPLREISEVAEGKRKESDRKGILRTTSETLDNLKEKQMKSINMFELHRNIESLEDHAKKYEEIRSLKEDLGKVYDYKMRWLKEEENSDILQYEILMFTDENGRKHNRG